MPTTRNNKGQFASKKRKGAAKKEVTQLDRIERQIMKLFDLQHTVHSLQTADHDRLVRLTDLLLTPKPKAPAPPQQEGGEDGWKEIGYINLLEEARKWKGTDDVDDHEMLARFAEHILVAMGDRVRDYLRLVESEQSKAPAPVEFKEGDKVKMLENLQIQDPPTGIGVVRGPVQKGSLTGRPFVQVDFPGKRDDYWVDDLRHATPEEIALATAPKEEPIKVGDYLKCTEDDMDFDDMSSLEEGYIYRVEGVKGALVTVKGAKGWWRLDHFSRLSAEEIATHEREEKQRTKAAELKEVLAQIGPLKDRLLRVQHYRPATLLRDAERDIQEQLGVDQ